MKIIKLIQIPLMGLFILLFSPILCRAQTLDSVNGPTYSLRDIDSPPMVNTIVGLVVGRMEHMKDPVVSKKERKRGEVTIQITITKEGKIVNPVILQSLGKAYDEEAMRVIKILQDKTWENGFKDGKPVNVSVQLPFEFPKKN